MWKDIASLLDYLEEKPWPLGALTAIAIAEVVKPVLAPELKPGLTVIMDNASFHKAPAILETIEKAGCELLFLPPYSPDLNPVAKRTQKGGV